MLVVERYINRSRAQKKQPHKPPPPKRYLKLMVHQPLFFEITLKRLHKSKITVTLDLLSRKERVNTIHILNIDISITDENDLTENLQQINAACDL